ncbi:hypothetical protein [Ruegeria sp. Alg231-54]|uniref:hypothetical protein n=1 Tax=Ruegeria sp. Alg231-54 TaxID=1922221 RepID=UPI000D5584DF|nr:hypothetical protein [Ruegeria sp. Alg231-54]
MKKKLTLLAIGSGILYFVLAIYFLGHAMWDFHDDANNFGLAYKFFVAKACAVIASLLMTSVLFGFTERFVFAPLVIFVSGAMVLLVGYYVVKDEPWRFQHIGSEGYRVPRSYAVGLDYGPPGGGLRVVYCAHDFGGGRRPDDKKCERTGFSIRHTSSPFYRELSRKREVSCNTYSDGEKCRVATDTELGQLNYAIKSPSIAPEDAEELEGRLLNLLRGWRLESESSNSQH